MNFRRRSFKDQLQAKQTEVSRLCNHVKPPNKDLASAGKILLIIFRNYPEK